MPGQQEMLPMTPADAAEARAQRQAYIGILQRCRELEVEALVAIRTTVGAIGR